MGVFSRQTIEAYIPIPRTGDEITPAWIAQVLGYPISENNFVVTPNFQDGTGFLSLMLSVSCQVVESEETLNVVVKLLPQDEVPRQIVVSKEFDKTEIECYRTVLPRLVEQIPELQDFVCPFLYGNYGLHKGIYGSVLVLKDLKPLDYFPLNFGQEQTEEQIAEGIDFLAKLHVAGSLIERAEGKDLPSIFPYMNRTISSEQSGVLGELCFQGFSIIDQMFLEFEDMEDTRKVYHDLCRNTGSILQIIQTKCSEHPSIIHGDLWSNNFLFNKDLTMHTKVIDWQLLGYKDATVDIGVYILSSIPVEMIKKERVEELLKLYHASFEQLCKDKGAEDLVKRDWDTFSKFFMTYGLAYTLIWFVVSLEPMVTKDKGKLFKILDFLHKEMDVPEFIFGEIEKMNV